MTTVYFIRHAESNFMNPDDLSRELTVKGMEDRALVTQFLSNKNIDVVFSSPFKRAVDTISDFADLHGLEVHIENDFREREAAWVDDYSSFCLRQWQNFDYKMSDGESLKEVQTRNISVLQQLLKEYKNKAIVVGSHGTALGTIINYYDRNFGYTEFDKIKSLMPWVVKFSFQDDVCTGIEAFDLFEQ